MTDLTPIDKRDSLRARIEAAERRNADRTLADQARAAADAAIDYTRANPLTVIGGALAAGVVIGLLTRPGRRMASRAYHNASDAISDASSSVSRRARGLASRSPSRFSDLIGDTAMAYIMKLLDEAVEGARAAQDRAEALGDTAGTQAKKLGHNAVDAASSAADSTRALARKARSATTGAVRDLRRKAKV
ncbi:hypothetical protein [Porphyrobacter sp. YT40]|uniref:hypothetical protein n=1 Tax=Porphyrobacter sp. YT40 TaxID=2547601 RepID=UPI001144E801|nr:hypothetical protein [Porphyrobacter sp. YT40]QDH35032.1 hypothetical protein E2E27_12285 [Porphyrobacter sp. YT40]